MLALADYSTFIDFGAHVSFIEKFKNSFFNTFNLYSKAREEI